LKRQRAKGYRVGTGEEVEVVRLTPETPEDGAEIARLGREGLISRGDTFAEQREHARLRRERRSNRRKPA